MAQCTPLRRRGLKITINHHLIKPITAPTMRNVLLFLAMIALFGNCKTHKEMSMTTKVADTKLIMLQTFACRGFCPVYTLTAYNSGKLDYNGERFVEKTGAATVTLTAKELEQLRAEVTKTDLWQYDDDIKSQVMDAPYATLTTWKDDKTKSVRGSIDRPKPVLELEKLMKNLAEAHGLKVIKGVNPNPPAKSGN